MTTDIQQDSDAAQAADTGMQRSFFYYKPLPEYFGGGRHGLGWMVLALAAVALQARPVSLPRASKALLGHQVGTTGLQEAVQEAAEKAYKQCRPLENVPGDAEWRHEMVPVYVRRTIAAALERTGPVHHI